MSPPDDLTWLALTVYLEAEGESYEGKLAVAFCIVNRAILRKRSIPDTVLAAYQFSAWNTDSRRRLAVDTIDKKIWSDCVEAGLAAMHRTVADPTNGSTHYLNPAVVVQAVGELPSWAADPADRTQVEPAKIKAVIGKHTFLVA